MADPRLRQLKIKTGVVKRLAKEQEYNHKEIAQQEKRIETFKAENRDEYDIKKQVIHVLLLIFLYCIAIQFMI